MDIIYFDSNGPTTEWNNNTAYSVGDIVNAIDENHPVVYQCIFAGTSGSAEPKTFPITPWEPNKSYGSTKYVSATADDKRVLFDVTSSGTSGASEPIWDDILGNTTIDNTVTWTAVSWWRDGTGDVISDGTVLWVAVQPFAWEQCFLTVNRAINAWNIIGVYANLVYGEKLHLEAKSSLLELEQTIDLTYSIAPVYRVDKLSGEYAPAKSDGSSNINFQTTNGAMIIVEFHAKLHGFNFEAGGWFEPKLKSILLEDCVIEFGKSGDPGGGGADDPIIYLYGALVSKWVNCLVTQVESTNGRMSVASDSYFQALACTFNITSDVGGFLTDFAATSYGITEFVDCDMSLSSPTLVDSSEFAGSVDQVLYATQHRQEIRFIHCQVPDNYLLWDGTWYAERNTYVLLENCGTVTGTDANIQEKHVTPGSMVTNFLQYLTDGYVDPMTTIPLSQSLSAGNRTSRTLTVDSSRIGGYIRTLGLQVFTIEMLEDFALPLKKSQLWLDFYYFDSVNNSFKKLDTSTKEFAQVVYTDLNQGIGKTEWTNSTEEQRSVKLSVTVSVAKEGIYFGIVRLGSYESGKTVLINPKFLVA